MASSSAAAQPPAEHPPRPRAWYWEYVASALVALVLGTIVIAAVDRISLHLNKAVQANESNWWGAEYQQPYWAAAAALDSPEQMTSRNLALTIQGGQATAVYTLTAPAHSSLIRKLMAHPAADSGDDLVGNVLGAVGIAEFNYGFTGTGRSWVFLTFQDPQVSITGSTATVTVTSDPLSLSFQRQDIEVDHPADVTVTAKAADRVRVLPGSVQLSAVPDGARLPDTVTPKGRTATNLSRGQDILYFTVSESSGARGWLDGLRALGGTEMPIAEDLLGLLPRLLILVTLLWSLQPREGDALSESDTVVLARKAAVLLIAALGALGSLQFASDLCRSVFRSSGTADCLAAAPVGLLVSAAVLAWPVACLGGWASTAPPQPTGASPGRPTARWSPKRWKTVAQAAWKGLSHWHGGAAAVHGMVLAAYWLVVARYASHVPSVRVVLLSLIAAACLAGLARVLLGDRPVAVPLVSAGLLAGALTTTMAWPLLWYYYNWSYGIARVNVLGKFIVVAVAVAVTAGLAIMTWRVAARVGRSGNAGQAARWWRWVAAVIVAGIALTAVPIITAGDEIFHPDALGRTPGDLFGTLGNVTTLLDWLALGLAIAVVTSLPLSHGCDDPRPLARRVAFPIAVTLFAWYVTWLEVPVAVIACLLLLKRMALPYKLVSCFPQPRDTKVAHALAATALSRAVGQWRRADFTAGQRQALSASSTDKLRDYLMDGGQDKYRAGLAALDDEQEELAQQRMTRQREARRATIEALSHEGDTPERSAARRGAIVGAIVGIIPGVIMVLTSQPGLAGGEPVSNFLSGTAWTLFQWPAIGWFVGYYRPLLRGRNGTEKAFFLAVIAIVANLPATIVWDNKTGLAYDFTSYLEMLVFLVLISVYACDLLTLKEAGFRFTDWPQVHNWRFVVTWSTALVAAIGTAAVTFLTVATTDLANSTFNPRTGQSSSTSSSGSPSATGGSGG